MRGLPDPVWYVDIDRSASDERKPRPAFSRLMSDVRAGRRTVILCRDADRFLRRPRELEDVIDILGPRDVPVYFHRDSDYDLSSAGGRQTARLKASIARGEVEKMSERKRAANAYRVRQGIPNASHRPFGYRHATIDGVLTFVQDPVEAAGIRWAYEFVMRGGTLADVARRWNAEGLRTTRGTEWKWGAVKQTLLNPAVGGFRYYAPRSILVPRTEKFRHAWEHDLLPGNWRDRSILTEQEYRGMRTVLTATRSQAGNRLRHLGSGIYLCGRCNDGTVMRSSRREDRALIYRCVGYGHLRVAGAALDAWVLEMLRRALVDRRTFEDAFGSGSAPDRDRALWEGQLAEARRRLDELADAYASGRLSISAYERASRRFEEQARSLEERLSEISVESASVSLMSFEEVDARLESATLTERRQLIRDIFPRITLRSPGQGVRFDPLRHATLIDRAGREWPAWLLTTRERQREEEQLWRELWKQQRVT